MVNYVTGPSVGVAGNSHKFVLCFCASFDSAMAVSWAGVAIVLIAPLVDRFVRATRYFYAGGCLNGCTFLLRRFGRWRGVQGTGVKGSRKN